MMKNSEWGAVSYLAESKFGRNEVAVTKNGNSSFFTGDGDYKNNDIQKQSTTGNIYGVYDTVGGTNEYIASYIPNERVSYGYNFTSTDGTKNNKKESTPYATAYKYNSNSDSNTNNYTVNLNKVFGDGICETSTEGSGTTSWYSACSEFVNSPAPFFLRGGNRGNSGAGSFYFHNGVGGASESRSSYVVCIVK